MYYFLTQNLVNEEGMADISGHTSTTGKYLWTEGHKFNEEIPIQVLQLDTSDGDNMPDLFDTTVPVISEKFVKVLKEAGVDNFDLYPVILKDSITGEEHSNYYAINFIGSIDAVNQQESVYELDSFDEPEYESIVIDEAKVKSFKVFRLSSGPDLLVINHDVAEYIKSNNIKGILITETVNLEDI